ncbi:MAG: HAD family hydrolase [Clostridia bacterium]|nr:HAD family hydrolase [Clostridia bacterium]
MKYDAVIFDLDGTILSTLEDLADGTNYALQANGLATRTIDEVRRFVGNGVRLLIERAVPENTPLEIIDKVQATFAEYYTANCSVKTKPYDGVLEMLTNLRKRGIKTAVLSNKPDYAVQPLCKQYFDGYLDAASGEVTGITKKPAPDGVYRILDIIGAKADRCVYVGDSDVDVLTAKNSKMDCIAVDWGFRDRDNLTNAGATVIASTPEELFELIVK